MTHTPTDALRLVPRRAVYDWLRDDVPLNVKMTVMPHHIDALLDRLSAVTSASPPVPWQHRQIEDDGVNGYRYAVAPASPLPGGGDTDWQDKAEGLESDLRQAVLVAWKRGAEEWCRLNYPQWVEWLEACHAPAAPTGDA